MIIVMLNIFLRKETRRVIKSLSLKSHNLDICPCDIKLYTPSSNTNRD